MCKRRFLLMIALTLLFFTSQAFALPHNLKGSISAQKKQNWIADKYKLSRLKNKAQLIRFIDKDLLVLIGNTKAYYISQFTGMLDPDNWILYHHARPWVKSFLNDLLVEGFAKHGEIFRVTSLIRTRWYQKKLSRSNKSAISGRKWWQRSSHMTGSTVDLSYRDLSPKVISWLERKLSLMEKQGLIEATKEFGTKHFHIMVHPKYEYRLKRLIKRRKKKRRSKTRR